MSKLANGMAVDRTTILADGLNLDTDTYLTGLNNNLLVVGGSGSGKSSSVIMPNIMQINSSYVVIDPKGALYADLAPGLEAAGYAVDVIDFSRPMRSTVSWNPLAGCRDDGELRDTAMTLVSEHGVSRMDPFWQEQAAALLVAVVKLIAEEGEEPTVGGVIDALDQLHEVGDESTKPAGWPTGPLHSTYTRLDERFVSTAWHTPSSGQPGDGAPGTAAPGAGVTREDVARARDALNRAEGEYERAFARQRLLRDEVEERFHLTDDRLFEVTNMISLTRDPALRAAIREGRRRRSRTKEARRALDDANARHQEAMRLEGEARGDAGHRAGRPRPRRGGRTRRPSEAYDRYLGVRNTAPETWACIVNSLAPRLDAFREPALLRLLGRSDIGAVDMVAPARRASALFVVISDVNRALDLLAGVFVKQCMRALVRHADSRPERRCDQPVRFVLDDFANMAPIPEMDTWIAAVRSREIWVTLAIQSMSQLDALYGRAAETIVGNCDVRLYFTPTDLRTALDVSVRAMVPPSDVMALGTDVVWVLVRGEPALRERRFHLEGHPNWRHFWDACHVPNARALAATREAGSMADGPDAKGLATVDELRADLETSPND